MYVYHIIISSTSYIFAEHHKLLSNVCHVRHSISICGKSLPHTDYKSPAVGPPDHTTPAVVTYRIQCYNSVNKYNCYCPVTAASRRWRERRVRWGCPCGAGCTLTAFHRLYSIDYLRNDVMKRTILCNCWQKVGWQWLVSCYWMPFALFWSCRPPLWRSAGLYVLWPHYATPLCLHCGLLYVNNYICFLPVCTVHGRRFPSHEQLPLRNY